IDQIIRMMVGRTIFAGAPEIPKVADPNVVLDVRGLTRGRAVRDVSFTLRRGEILGFAGLVGAGRTEVARAVFGADRADTSDVRVHGKVAHIKSPGDAVHLGIGYLPGDRQLNDLARQGKAIVMISSELPEILRMSHRIVVMCEGRITGELDGHNATQEQIMTFATMRASVAKAS